MSTLGNEKVNWLMHKSIRRLAHFRSWDSKKKASEHLTLSDLTLGSVEADDTCDWRDLMKQLRAVLSWLKLHCSFRALAKVRANTRALNTE